MINRYIYYCVFSALGSIFIQLGKKTNNKPNDQLLIPDLKLFCKKRHDLTNYLNLNMLTEFCQITEFQSSINEGYVTVPQSNRLIFASNLLHFI